MARLLKFRFSVFRKIWIFNKIFSVVRRLILRIGKRWSIVNSLMMIGDDTYNNGEKNRRNILDFLKNCNNEVIDDKEPNTLKYRLIKICINNFRSVKNLHINLYGNLLVLTGANESGKTNILKAIEWALSDDVLGDNKPVDADEDEIKNSPIVELYFEVYGDDKVKYIKIEKYWNGRKKIIKYNDKFEPAYKDMSSLFEKHLEKSFKEFIKLKHGYEADGTSFGNFLNITSELLREIKKSLESLNFYRVRRILDENIGDFIQWHSDWKVYVLIRVGGEYVRMYEGDIKEIYENALSQLISDEDYEVIDISNIEVIYLSEKMKLRGTYKKQRSWKSTINSDELLKRLFAILKIDLDEFDLLPPNKQHKELKNKLLRFSKELNKIWRQENIRIEENITENELHFVVTEYDENNEPIRSTSPEDRSIGFAWFLSYFITLKYLKLMGDEKSLILLLDDPAVYLHEIGKKDFLKVLNELTDDGIVVIYTTHDVSLIDESKIESVSLVVRGIHETTIKHPWVNLKDCLISPLYRELGVDKLIFGDVKDILFVEGISDKFILEGLQKIGVLDKKWHIYPLSGGYPIDKEKVVDRIKFIRCLLHYTHKRLNYHIILDGCLKSYIEEHIDDEDVKSRIIYLGDEDNEIEDLIDLSYYMKCVKELLIIGYLDDIDKLKDVLDDLSSIKKELKNKNRVAKELIKILKDKYDIAITKSMISAIMKNIITKEDKKYFNKLIKHLDKLKNET